MIENLHLIVGYDTNRAIGFDQDMPWGRDLKDDLANFKQLTSGNTVIMGRKTYESIGRPLPNRMNIVISRQKDLSIDGVTVVSSLDEVQGLELPGTPYIMGGSQIYSLALPYVSKIIATEVNHSFGEADSYFDELDGSWVESSRKHHAADDRNAYNFDIVEYSRISTDSRLVYVDPSKVRSEDQLAEYERIFRDGVDPFSIEHRAEYTQGTRLYDGEYFWLFQNNWPYKNTRRHIMAVTRQHQVYMEDIPRGAGNELFQQYAELEKSDGYSLATICARFGFVMWTGASVAHFHTHLLIPEDGEDTYVESHELGELVINNSNWTAYKSANPHEHAREHFILVSNTEASYIHELEDDAGDELFQIMKELEGEYEFTHGGFAMRVGDRKQEGETQGRLICEFLTPKDTVYDDPSKKIRMTVSEDPAVDFKIST